jgi:hypothetical protein
MVLRCNTIWTVAAQNEPCGNEFVHKIGAPIALALCIIYIGSLFLKLD